MGNEYIRFENIYSGNRQPDAFMFHAACWDLFMKHFVSGELKIDRLFQFCTADTDWAHGDGLLHGLYSMELANGV
ncbi:hypothetical protein ASPWEDRAFT_41101 [Aspergillus wentii DTO 134E9]|uniref:Uncharacterized protein n=1 Tax=Aspergillus wentii DTO 134E9 TaxID=1073089 RepID=A0A1L9RM25_ASPWE|nr:uncharacterized protein ASPWEDRAFT_41101 [Aspergillus wentii DTO 134E9]OJJ35868.1 hypothetical protein ASPWEDRAFT_41101 [Aspergillus wentii DTO 134E9]